MSPIPRQLSQLARVLRPGGRIVIAEPDWRDLRVHGCPAGLADDVQRRLRGRIRQPDLARSLTDLLAANGLCLVREHRLPLAIHDGVMARRIVAHSAITAHAQREWRTRTHERRQRGLAFVTLPMTAVTARKHEFSHGSAA